MKVKKLDHICIAVKNLDAARKIWETVLGKSEPDDPYVDEPEKIRVARYWLGGVGFEIMESTSPDGPVGKWIEKNGEGVMLISFNVENTRDAVRKLEGKDYPFIPNPEPLADDATGKVRPFRDCEFAFLHPRKMNNVLLELIDYKWKKEELESADYDSTNTDPAVVKVSRGGDLYEAWQQEINPRQSEGT